MKTYVKENEQKIQSAKKKTRFNMEKKKPV
jgi:hypothetical protein